MPDQLDTAAIRAQMEARQEDARAALGQEGDA